MPGVTGQGGSACDGTGSALPTTGPSRSLRWQRNPRWWQPQAAPPRDGVRRALLHRHTGKPVTGGPHLRPVPRHPPPASCSPPPSPASPFPSWGPSEGSSSPALTQGCPPSAARPAAPQNGRRSLTALSQSRGRAPRSCTASGPGPAAPAPLPLTSSTARYRVPPLIVSARTRRPSPEPPAGCGCPSPGCPAG